MGTPDRSELHFAHKVKEAFLFLTDEDYVEVEALPTLVRYRKGNLEVDVYHGRQSYEIGGSVCLWISVRDVGDNAGD